MFTRGLNQSSSDAPLAFSLATIVVKVPIFFYNITHIDRTERTAVKGRPPIRFSTDVAVITNAFRDYFVPRRFFIIYVA